MDVRERLTRTDWPARLALLGVEEPDRAPIQNSIEATLANPDHVAIVQRYADELLLPGIGQWRGVFDRPGFPTGDDRPGAAIEGGLELAAILATAEDVHRHHLNRRIDEHTSWQSLADIGQQVTKHRLVSGTTGLTQANWLRNVWTGDYLRLGRLQFELYETTFNGVLTEPMTVLNCHIPASGPMSPELVQESLDRAGPFFATHFADQLTSPLEWIMCESWLLDRQLPLLLPGSNIADFCARWDVLNARRNDRDGFYFVFNAEPAKDADLPGDVDHLPERTSLERAIVGLWRRGGHVHTSVGRLPIQ